MGENWFIPVVIGLLFLLLIGAAMFYMTARPSAPMPPMPPMPTYSVSASPSSAVVTRKPPPAGVSPAYLLPNSSPSVITVPTDNGTIVYVDVRKLDQMPGLTQEQKDWIVENLSRWGNEPAVEVGGAGAGTSESTTVEIAPGTP